MTVGGTLGTRLGEESFIIRSIPILGSPRSLQHPCITEVSVGTAGSHPAMVFSQSMIARWWRMATNVSPWAFASAYATARILEDLQGFDPSSPRACFRSQRLWEVTCHTGSTRRRREFRFSLVVVWCRLVVRQSGVSCDVSVPDASHPGYGGGPPLEGHEPTAATKRGDT